MEIIKFIESQKLVKGLFGGNKIDLEKKDDWEVGLDLGNISNGFFVSQYISSCLSEYTPQYRHRYPEIDSQSAFRVDDNYKLQKYDPGGGYFIPHCENDGSTDLRRMLVWMIYLMDHVHNAMLYIHHLLSHIFEKNIPYLSST